MLEPAASLLDLFLGHLSTSFHAILLLQELYFNLSYSLEETTKTRL